jgi:hypothetical protein
MRVLISRWIVKWVMPLALPCLCCAQQYGNPPSFPCEALIRVMLYGEPLLASLRQDGISYAIRASLEGPLHGTFVEPLARWRPGFRIGCGVHFDHDAWEGGVSWTYFRSQLIQTVQDPFLTPLFIDASSYQQIPQGFMQEAKEQWRCSLNNLMVLLSRPYFLSQQLGIVPQVGFLANWIQQNLLISYRSDAVGTGVVAYQTTMGNDSWKVGPCIGTRVDWYIRKEIRLFGGVQGATLYRRVQAEQVENAIGNVGGDVRIFLTESAIVLQPWIDGQFGLGWGSCFRCAKTYLEVTLLYEVQYFWHELFSRTLMQQIPSSQNRFLNQYGDLSMQSASIRMRVDF